MGEQKMNGVCQKTGVGRRLSPGQKVWCYYHCTLFFSPPMCGTVLFKLPFKMKHHFAYGENYKNSLCNWYFVFMENKMIVLMPETCLSDLSEEIEKHNKNNKCPENVKVLDAWMMLNKWQADRVRYLNG